MWVLKFYRDTLGNRTGNLDGWKGSVNMYSCVLLWEWNNGCVGDFVNASHNLLCIYPLNRQFHNSALWHHTAKRYEKKTCLFQSHLAAEDWKYLSVASKWPCQETQWNYFMSAKMNKWYLQSVGWSTRLLCKKQSRTIYARMLLFIERRIYGYEGIPNIFKRTMEEWILITLSHY